MNKIVFLLILPFCIACQKSVEEKKQEIKENQLINSANKIEIEADSLKQRASELEEQAKSLEKKANNLKDSAHKM